ncbi:glycoprotein, partial [Rhodococcus ruber]|nr:glycoprotein [Rhodococcus ruber]
LVVVARNDLPVGSTVRLHVDAPSAMKITDLGPTQLPPRGSRTLTVRAQISDSRKIGVEFARTTESGLPLGTPTNVRVRSNAYGQVLAIVTGCSGALLLF